MDIYIPTRGRADSQRTSAILSEAGLKHWLVTEDDPKLYDLTTHPLARILRCKPSKLQDKRQFIVNHAGNKKFVMVDDDMAFRYRKTKGKKVQFVRSTPAKVRQMFKRVEKLLDAYAHVGLSDEFMCHTRPPGVTEGGRYNCFLAYNPSMWRKKWPKKRWPVFRLDLNHDHDVSLQLHMLGFPPAILRDYTKSTKPWANGGLTPYRKPKDEKRSHDILANNWPQFVHVVKSKTSMSGFRIAVSWRKAHQAALQVAMGHP